MREKLFDFFSDCWKQARGLQAKVPTYFCFEEEEYMLMDLRTGETINQTEAAFRAGSK